MVIEIIVSLFIAIGAFFIFSASVGLLRLPDVYCRMHATTKASTLGLINVFLASIVYFNFTSIEDKGFTIEEILVLVFTFISAPAAAHIMARSAYLLKTKMFAKTIIDELKGKHLDRERESLRHEVFNEL